MTANNSQLYQLAQDNNNCINVLIGNRWNEQDKETFFGPLDGTEQWIIITQFVHSLAFVLKEAGVFSLNIARKNGWDKPLNTGFSVWKVGKKPPLVISIFMPSLSTTEQTLAEALFTPEYA